ncbi:MAG: hypothetical protein JWO42_658 [Chloroflexi bacterium]|nr:hypothetical protein [Chloroflexota bacterium]
MKRDWQQGEGSLGATQDVAEPGAMPDSPESSAAHLEPFDAGVGGRSTARRYFELLPLVVAISGCLSVFLGVHVMHEQAAFTLWTGTPIGIFGDVFPNPQWVLLGTLCVLVGCLLAAFSLPALVTAHQEPVVPGSPVHSSRPLIPIIKFRSAWVGGVAAAAGLCLYAYVIAQAPSHQAGVIVLLCLIAATALFLLSIRLLLPGGRADMRRGLPALTVWDVAAIAAVTVAFVALMLHDARYWLYSFYGDEWAFYDAAASIARGNPQDLLSQAGVYGIHPWANSAYQGLVMRVFGINVVGWRLSSILSVALPVLPLYWLGLAVGGRSVAVAASVLYAGCHLLWAFSHIGYNNNDPLLVMVPAATLLYAGLRSDRSVYLCAAGACAGAAWYTLFSGRLMIGIAVLVLLTEWQGGWRAVARRLALLLAGFAIVVLPLVIDNGTDTIRQMFPLVSLSQARTQQAVSSLLGQNTVRGLYAFLYATQDSHYVLGEVFDTVSATALCVGVALALRHIRDLGLRLLLIWFVVGLMLTTPLYYAPQIADTRLQIVVPPAALLAAYGLATIARALASLVPRHARGLAVALIVGAALVGALVLNVDRFYHTMPDREQPTSIALTLGALQQTSGSTTLLAGRLANNNLGQVLDGFGVDAARVLYFQNGLPTVECPSPSTPPTHPTRTGETARRNGIDQRRRPPRDPSLPTPPPRADPITEQERGPLGGHHAG